MNVIVIVSDTFRRDHLGCYGNTKIYTPNLDSFAQEAVQFDKCYATSFPTMPMRADLFTGKFTFSYLGWAPLPSEEKILAEILKEANYSTLAAVDVPFFLRKGYGYDRGFDDFQWISGQFGAERPRITAEWRYEEDCFAPKTFTAAEKSLEFNYKNDFFLYVDTWDPHEPWDPPHWYVEPYYSGYNGRVVDPVYGPWREAGLSEEDLEIAHACYCGEITMVDRWVGRLIEKIKIMDLWEDTIIIFTSDHGYYFGEHDFLGKLQMDLNTPFVIGKSTAYQSPLYQEITRVPLLIRVPGIESKKVTELVSSVDIMPTILDLLRINIPEEVQGRSFSPILHGEKNKHRDFVVTSPPLYNPGDKSKIVDDWIRTVEEPHFSTITTPDSTFLYATENSPAQFYNTIKDPEESENIIENNWQEALDLHNEFYRLLREVGTDERFLSIRKKLNRF